jgi:murein DD-endopeptidase MepM/ murein hydrolase activator NlpD
MRRILNELFVCTLISFLLLNCERVQVQTDTEIEVISLDEIEEIEPAPAFDDYGFIYEEYSVETGTIRRNENLYLILRDYNISPVQIDLIQRAVSGHADLRRMRPGQSYHIYKKGGKAVAMVWNISKLHYLVMNWEQDEVEVRRDQLELKVVEQTASGTIETSLYEALQRDGITQLLGSAIAEIYAWEVDFFSLRTGDSFKVIYDELYVGDEFYGIGDVHAAEFNYRNRPLRAFKYDNGDRTGYFDEEGESMERALLKAPFEYNQRVSSGFSNNRLHPILRERRPHHGVDYAARRGTPIIAVGDGVVTEAQYRGGNGNIVQIRHNDVYRTAYLHMSGFAPGIRRGTRVEQGQVIGYVGATGLATGPHVCYRLYVHDRPVNSLTVELPASESLEEEHMDDFRDLISLYERELDRLESIAMESVSSVANAGGRN